MAYARTSRLYRPSPAHKRLAYQMDFSSFALALVLLLTGPGLVHSSDCSLDGGLWYDPGGSRNAQLIFQFAKLPDIGATVTAVTTNGQWTTGKVSYDPTTGNLTTYLDNGGTQVGTVDLASCARIEWSQPRGPIWVRVPKVDKVHVVFMNHLDVGYNGIPNTGFINNVLNTYFKVYFPRAIKLAAEMKATHPDEGFIYTTHPWLVSLYLDCPPNMVLNGIRLQCPSADEVDAFEAAIHEGLITWHAGAMNIQVELMNKEVFEASLSVASSLDAKFSRRKTLVLSQRDVPGMTTAAIPVLLKNGIQGVTVGVNSGSAPPAVPNLFQWEYQGEKIVAMWHPGGYPANPGKTITSAGGLSLFDCVIEPESKQALAFAFRTDNSGPPESVDEIETYYEILRGQFPDVKVFASTYDDFLRSINTKSLPVVRGEIGDTWIQGIASDPRKLAEFGAASSGFAACMQDGKCSLSDPQVSNASRFLVKLPEHTWGLPDVGDTVNWTNSAFQKAKRGANYVNCEKSWIEQRYFLNLTLQASSGHPLHEYITKALADIRPQPPSLEGYTLANPNQVFTLLNGNIMLAFDGKGGWITTLSYQANTSTSYSFAGPDNPLAKLSYYTYNETDFQYMSSQYDYYGNSGYDKPNSTVNAHPQSVVYDTQLEKLYQSTVDPNDFILQLNLAQVAHSYYGAPSELWVQLSVAGGEKPWLSSPTTSELFSLKFDIVWVNKTATRLAEATMFSFLPAQPKDSEWNAQVLKISNDTYVNISSVLRNGSQYQHVAREAVLLDSSSGVFITLSSTDAPLMCPIVADLKTPTPFPAPLGPIDPSLIKGIAFNLHNNVWNTNYALWYPFTQNQGDQDFKARFTASFAVS